MSGIHTLHTHSECVCPPVHTVGLSSAVSPVLWDCGSTGGAQDALAGGRMSYTLAKLSKPVPGALYWPLVAMPWRCIQCLCSGLRFSGLWSTQHSLPGQEESQHRQGKNLIFLFLDRSPAGFFFLDSGITTDISPPGSYLSLEFSYFLLNFISSIIHVCVFVGGDVCWRNGSAVKSVHHKARCGGARL